RAVGTLLRLDDDRERGADGLAKLAGDAALLAVRIAAQRVQATEARRRWRLFFRVPDRDLAREHVAPGQREPLEQLLQEQAAEKVLDRFHGSERSLGGRACARTGNLLQRRRIPLSRARRRSPDVP